MSRSSDGKLFHRVGPETGKATTAKLWKNLVFVC